MEQRALGRTGFTVSALGFGCGSVGGLMVRGDAAEQRRAVSRALDAGVTYFDTAPSYGDGRSEENLGRVLAELDAWSDIRVGTKVRLAPEELARPDAAILASVEQSLRRLQHGSVDLLQLHNPVVADEAAGGVPVAEVLGGIVEGLQQVVDAGMAAYAGFTGIGDAHALAALVASGRFATMQSYFNAVNPSAGFAGAGGGGYDFDGIVDRASAAGMGVIAIRVFAAGALSGTRERAPNASGIGGAMVAGGEFDADLARTSKLVAIASAAGLESTLELALRFALSKSGVSTALAGISTLRQLDDALRWAERGPLPESVVRQVVDAARN